jgi:hypothetical protein
MLRSLIYDAVDVEGYDSGGGLDRTVSDTLKWKYKIRSDDQTEYGRYHPSPCN